jgi:hypothetical protein
MGYTIILILKMLQKEEIFKRYLTAMMISFFTFSDLIATAGIFLLIFLAGWNVFYEKPAGLRRNFFLVTFGMIMLVIFGYLLKLFTLIYPGIPEITAFVTLIIAPALVCFFLKYRPAHPWSPFLKKSLLAIPLTVIFFYSLYYQVTFSILEKTGTGGWALQRNWEDIQRHVKANTPKDALILVPHDMYMGGFRILSERTIIACFRDCGIVGFDYQAGLEWHYRTRDIEPFKVIWDKNIEPAIINGIFKYRANYIVFMRYYEPPTETHEAYQKIYHNDQFSLYKILIHNKNR